MFRCMSPGAIAVKGSLDEQMAWAKQAGFEGFEMGLEPLAKLAGEIGVEGVKAKFRAAGLRVGAAGLPPAWRKSEEEHQAILKALPAQAALAAQVGATGCATWLSPRSAEMKFIDNFRWHAARLRPIAQILKDAGLRLGVEPVAPRTSRDAAGEYGFLYTIYGGLALGEAIGTGNVGLLLDSWHWFNALGTVSDIESLRAEDVVHVHLNDAPKIDIYEQQDSARCLPGETGVIDLKSFLGTLKKIGYQGAVTPEPMSAKLRQMASAEAAMAAGAAMKKVWEEAGV
ncbi:MAG: Inosose isomerase [candidate division BRC1 bacterium ADurb.BinA364]|nr:MAG: Inosose isomerase [candidate division BRC1 bacterium ADurb.BinA364]